MYKPFYCRTTPVDRLNWAKTTFWWWWDESNNTTLHIRHGIQKYTVACVCASTLIFGGRTASHNIQSLRVSGKETLCFFETFEPPTLSKQITELWHLASYVDHFIRKGRTESSCEGWNHLSKSSEKLDDRIITRSRRLSFLRVTPTTSTRDVDTLLA